MIYSQEVQQMCCVKKGANHESAPIPEEGKWVRAKEIRISLVLLTVSAGVLPSRVLVSLRSMLRTVLSRRLWLRPSVAQV